MVHKVAKIFGCRYPKGILGWLVEMVEYKNCRNVYQCINQAAAGGGPGRHIVKAETVAISAGRPALIEPWMNDHHHAHHHYGHPKSHY